MKLTLAAASVLILCTAASAQTPPAPQESADKAACKAAIEKLCPGVQPAGGRIKACLETHNTSVKQVCPGMGKHQGPHGHGIGNTATTPAPVAQPPAGQ